MNKLQKRQGQGLMGDTKKIDSRTVPHYVSQFSGVYPSILARFFDRAFKGYQKKLITLDDALATGDSSRFSVMNANAHSLDRGIRLGVNDHLLGVTVDKQNRSTEMLSIKCQYDGRGMLKAVNVTTQSTRGELQDLKIGSQLTRRHGSKLRVEIFENDLARYMKDNAVKHLLGSESRDLKKYAQEKMGEGDEVLAIGGYFHQEKVIDPSSLVHYSVPLMNAPSSLLNGIFSRVAHQFLESLDTTLPNDTINRFDVSYRGKQPKKATKYEVTVPLLDKDQKIEPLSIAVDYDGDNIIALYASEKTIRAPNKRVRGSPQCATAFNNHFKKFYLENGVGAIMDSAYDYFK